MPTSNYIIRLTQVPESQGGGWQCSCMIDGDEVTHVRTSLAAAVMAVTIEIHDHVEPYED